MTDAPPRTGRSSSVDPSAMWEARRLVGLAHETRAAEDARLYAMLAATNAAVLRSLSRPEVFDELCRVVTADGDFRMAWVALGSTSGRLVPVAAAGRALAVALERQPSASAPIAEKAWRSGELVVVDDIADDPLTVVHRSTSVQARTRSGCAIPIRCRGEMVGVFSTYMERSGGYDRQRLELLERLVDDVAFALEAIEDRERKDAALMAQALSERSLEVRVRMHAEVSRLGRFAMTVQDLDGLYRRMAQVAHALLGVDVAAVEHVLDDGTVVVRSQVGLPSAPRSPVSPGQAVRTLQVFGAPVVTCTPIGYDGPLLTVDPSCGWAAAVGIPLPDDRIDVLVVGSRTEREFARDEIDFLQTMATIAATTADRLDTDQHLLSLAFHDSLTGLPNRTRLFECIEHAAASSRPGHAIAVLLIDLDGFKDVNDALGHDVGDQLLVAVADRLDRHKRPEDIVARLGGDEFAVLCPDVPDTATAVEVARSLSHALDEPFELDGVATYISSSIGITVRTTSDSDVRALLREADAALYVAKDGGRGRWEVFDERMQRKAVERLEMSNALRQAVDAGQLRLVWQPAIALPAAAGDRSVVPTELRRSGVSLEALLRWNHPDLGVVAPSRFITLAEETGLIVSIGEWVMREALRQMARWTSEDLATAPDLIAINLSARQLAQRDLVQLVRALLDEYGVDPCRVAFEITETAVLADPEASIRTLTQLREFGLSIAIDDFGTGYSSLSYLRDLPLDALKIDRSFVSRLGAGGGDDEIVRSVISLAHGFGLVVIGEGVETLEQRDALVSMGCDRGQGYFWSPPLEAGEVTAWIRDLEGRSRGG